MIKTIRRAMLAASIPLALFVAPAAHADVTRDQYIAQAEPICQANTDSNRAILAGARQKVKKKKFKPASVQVAKAAAAFQATVNQIAALPQPSADAPGLASWITYLHQDGTLLGNIASALKSKNTFKAEKIQVQLSHTATQTNDIVGGFGFSACLIHSSDFF